jgi:hypothetical protein
MFAILKKKQEHQGVFNSPQEGSYFREDRCLLIIC